MADKAFQTMLAIGLTIGLTLTACSSSQSAQKSAAGQSGAWWHITGSCDASALAPVPGTNDFIFAVDEDDTLRRWISPGAYPPPGGEAAGKVDEWMEVSSAVENAGGIDGTRAIDKDKKGNPREMDLEGAAQIGEQIFWIGSHGLNKDGKYRPNRMVFFATNVPTPTNSGELSGKARDLLPALQAADGISDVLAPPVFTDLAPGEASGTAPKSGGLNIEGLATDGTSLLIGLRSPVTDSKAWILRLANPAEIVANIDAAPQISVDAQIDLGDGRGVRSMTELDNDWLIVGGPVDNPPPDFALLQWDGTQVPASVDYAFTGGTRPEGITTQGKNVLMVSDDGSVIRDGTECKKEENPNNQYFRATSVPAAQLSSSG